MNIQILKTNTMKTITTKKDETTTTEKINLFLKEKTPFSVMKYFVEAVEIHSKEYELVYFNNKQELSFLIMDEDSVRLFKTKLNDFTKVIDNKYGTVYEFNKFKEYKEQKEIESKKKAKKKKNEKAVL